MHTDISYKGRLTPKFDAVEDVKEWFGKRWDTVSPMMSQVKDPDQFDFYAGLGGVSGFPVVAWYDLYHGEGAYDKAVDEKEARLKFEENQAL